MSAENHEDLQQHVKKYVKIGILLGVFTIIVLMRPSVQALFGRPAPKP